MIKRYELPTLTYDYADLEPVISAEIMELHHSKHHAGYVKGANAALDRLEAARSGDESVDIKATMRDLSFHVNGHVLHEIFWKTLQSPEANNSPSSTPIESKLEEHFGSYEAFATEFSKAAKAVEGSGWAVLSTDDEGNLLVHQVQNHNLLQISGFNPILVLDVWEHAYYLDYKNDRGSYVDGFWQIVDWDAVSELYTTATK